MKNLFIVLGIMITSLTMVTKSLAQNDCSSVQEHIKKLAAMVDENLAASSDWQTRKNNILYESSNIISSIKSNTGVNSNCNCVNVNFLATDLSYAERNLLSTKHEEDFNYELRKFVGIISSLNQAIKKCHGN